MKWPPLPAGATVSVVICAFNEAEHVDRLLSSLAVQTRPPLEVLVVDDGSTDHTSAIAKSQGALVLRVAHRGPARGRNLGARIASGDILIFLDGDMSCEPRFIEMLVRP